MQGKYERLKRYYKFIPAIIAAGMLLIFAFAGSTAGIINLHDEPYYPVRSFAPTSDITVLALPMYPPTVTNGTGASNIGSSTARLNGEITDDGNTNPVCIVYWGTSDGTDNASAWSNNASIGAQPLGTIYRNVAGLAPATLHYYRWYAYNDEGGDWADSSANFTTLAFVTPPSGLILTDLGFNTVSINWTKGSGNYTMIRGVRNGDCPEIAGGELIYYGTGTSVNVTGLDLDVSLYRIGATSYLSDNTTHSTSICASIGGEEMENMGAWLLLGFIPTALLVAMFVTRQSMLGFPSALFWAILGGYAATQFDTAWVDWQFYVMFGSLMGMVPFSALSAYGLRTRKQEKQEGDENIDEKGNGHKDKTDIYFDETEEYQPSLKGKEIRERARSRRRNLWT